MARIIIDQSGKVGVTMDNGQPVALRPNWESMELYRGPRGEVRVEVVTYPGGGEDWFTSYEASLTPVSGGLADGRTQTAIDGGICRRYGSELHFRS